MSKSEYTIIPARNIRGTFYAKAMSVDYADKELAFISGLERDTGTGLDGWMKAIADSRLTKRNDIIDWLRHQGFTFANASWLERIHHNDGQLIYAATAGTVPDFGDQNGVRSVDDKAAATSKLTAGTKLDGSAAAVTEVLKAAKGLRPLAGLVLKEIELAVPGVTFAAKASRIEARAPAPFLVLSMGPSHLRLYGQFDCAADARVQASDGAVKPAAAFPGMILLNDARQIDDSLRTLISAAHLHTQR